MSTDPTAQPPGYRAAWWIAGLITLALGAANLVFGELNQDEGWYLIAALRTADGLLPYRDFAFTQGPMLPLVYGLAAPLIETGGVGGGRLLTWLLGLGAALTAAAAARRLGGAAAGVLAFTLIGVNVYQSYFFTVVKTYALCGLFLALAVAAATRWLRTPHPGWMAACGAALAAAAGTRLSSGILLPIFGLWFLLVPGFRARRAWWWFGLGGGAMLVALYLPFLVLAPDGVRFGLLEYHTAREAGGAAAALVFKAGFVSRLVQAYFVAAILLAALAAAKVWRPFAGQDSGYHQSLDFSLVRLLWVAVLALTAVHLTAPFPYDDYQTPLFPVLAVALSVSWATAVRAWSATGWRWSAVGEPADPRPMRWVVACVLLASIAAAFSSPINQDWMIAGRDRIWWQVKDAPALVQLRRVAAEVRAAAGDGLLLTQDTYLAVEAGLDVPRGWEMGPFSYYPDLDDATAERLHLVNRRMLRETLAAAPARVAAFSGYSLAIASPQVVPLTPDEQAELLAAVHARYESWREVPRFGQAGTTLRLYLRRGDGEAAP